MSKKTIKTINVTITYSVRLTDVELSEQVYDELLKSHEENIAKKSDLVEQLPNASEWVVENIKEEDCYDWEFELYELEG